MNISTTSTSRIVTSDLSKTQPIRDSLRSRHRLDLTLSRLFMLHATANVLLITSTFRPGISRREAMLRFDKLLRKLQKEGSDYIWVFERGHAGHVHFHLLLVVPFDARKGVDLAAYSLLANDALSAKRKLVNKPTRDLWIKVNSWCRNFGIGRTEVAPIYQNSQAISKYLLKSVKHNWSNRKVAGESKEDQDKGSRWWSCSRGVKAVYGKFSFVQSRFREAAELYAEHHGLKDLDEVKEKLGPRWAYRIHQYGESICPSIHRKWGVPLAEYLTGGATLGAPITWNPSTSSSDVFSSGSLNLAVAEPEQNNHAESMMRSQDWRSGPGRRDDAA